MKLLFLDTETTGNILQKDHLCSVCYKNEDGLVHELFRPPVPISVDAMAVHHITNRMVEKKDAFADSKTKQDLQALLADSVLVAHNAAFDIGVLENEGLKVPNYICTLKVARHLDEEGKIPRFSLQYLRYWLDLNVENAPAHDARGDVLVLEAIFDWLMSEALKKVADKETALKLMVELTQQPVLLRTMGFGKYRGQLFEEIAKKDTGYLKWLLDAKRKDAAGSSTYGNDVDLIHTLNYYLEPAQKIN